MNINTNTPVINRNKLAITAGVASLVMFFAAIFAEGYARPFLLVSGDMAQTLDNIRQHSSTVKCLMVSYGIILICDILVAWAMYNFVKNTKEELAQLCAWFRLIYTAMFAASIFHLFQGIGTLSNQAFDTANLTSFAQLQAQSAFSTYETSWTFSMIFFGIHLLMLAYLLLHESNFPKWLGAVLAVAAVAYMIDSSAKLFASNYAQLKPVLNTIVAISAVVGEVGLGIWLLWKGRNSEQSSQ